MRVMVFVKATADSEAGLPPTEDMTEMFAAMGAFNEQLVEAGIMVDGDMDEAIAWAKRCPNPMPGPSELEIRPFYELEDFGDAMTPEQAEQEKRLREKLEETVS